MTISMIWAQTPTGVIGDAGDLPWHLPEDLARFKALTREHVVIMGRGTWDSLPDAVRPMPGRRNIVLSRDPDFAPVGAVGATSVTKALMAARGEDAWIIGGGQVYRAFLQFAERIEVTVVDLDLSGDTYAPNLPANMSATTEGEWQTSKAGLRYRYVTYTRQEGFDA